MCGINGIVRLDGSSPAATDVQAMARRQAHRGPDGEGVQVVGHVGLGHRRLSILDLSDAGAQPMLSHDGRYAITYNGEVYNYVELRQELEARGSKFTSGTDTEVILEAFARDGPEALRRFNGMFAFAIHDRTTGEVFLARDAFGIKPLYYATVGTEFAFASEIKALFALPWVDRSPNMAAVVRFLDTGATDTGSETFYQGVRAVEPGQFILINGGTITSGTWFQPWTQPAGAEPIKEFHDLFLDAVRITLRSDVPVGVCLSGGLDSSSIAGAMHRLHPGAQFAAFTAGFPGSKFDETGLARKVADAAGFPHHVITPDGSTLIASIEAIVAQQDEPFISTSMFAHWEVVRLAHETGIKVVMDGQGSDEILAGYDYLYANLFHEKLASGNLVALGAEMRAYYSRKRSTYAFKVFALGLLPKGLRQRFVTSSLVHPKWASLRGDNPYVDAVLGAKSLNAGLAAVRANRLAPLLRFWDRNAMAHSVEARVPFLDQRLVAFCNDLPSDWKIRDGTTKRILRTALTDLVPPEILERKQKIGFFTAQDEWMKRPEVIGWIRRVISSSPLAALEVVSSERLSRLLLELDSGRLVDTRPLWRVLCLALWLQGPGPVVPRTA